MRLKICLAVLMVLVAAQSYAGPFTDEMSKCLVRSTSEADKALLIKWIFAAMSNHPDLRSLSKISKQQGDLLNRQASDLVTKLVTNRCKSESKQALEFEGEETFKASFSVLGQVAMQGLMANNDVTNYFNGFAESLDAKAFQRAFGDKK